MTPDAFAAHIRSTVVDENADIYRDLFTNPDEDGEDGYWKEARALFAGLDDDQKEVFFTILRQVIVDTTSTILGVVDGTVALPGIDDDFSLRLGRGPEMAGDLQDCFLSQEEDDTDGVEF